MTHPFKDSTLKALFIHVRDDKTLTPIVWRRLADKLVEADKAMAEVVELREKLAAKKK